MTHRVLVTGGAGFIGVNLASVLADHDVSVTCFDNFACATRADSERAGYAHIVEGDVRDRDALTAATAGMEYVVHLAAQAGVPASVVDPVEDCDVNVLGTLNALLAARDAGVAGFVLASSNAPLGEVEPPAHEGLVPRPRSPYGASKLAGEAYCSAFAASYGMATVALRFANVYGPFSYHKGSVIASFCRRALAGDPLVVYGDGEQTRDFVFVRDVCVGISEAMRAGISGEVVHLGTGVETSINDVVHTLGKLLPDRELHIEQQPSRPGDVTRNCADIALARKLFRYEPSTSLTQGLSMTLDWFREVIPACDR